jgi:CDP-6-deoxy-D-xylo-4-hexulose-3-dehydrase
MRCPVHGAILGEQEQKNLYDVADRAWYTNDEYTRTFERGLSQRVGVNHALFVNSGSSANLLAMSALADYEIEQERRILPGDEVITTAISFATTVAPIVQVGAVPVFVDMLQDFSPDIDAILRAITRCTKAIVLTHTLGFPFQAAQIRAICDKYNLWLVEDTCDALGAIADDKPAGDWGNISTLSFYPAHTITTGEGGMALTSSHKLFRIMKSCRDWGKGCYCEPGQDNACGHRFDGGFDHKHTHVRMGYNLKATEMQAAIGVAQLDRLDGFISKRRANYDYLYMTFPDNMRTYPLPDGAAPFGFPFLVPEHYDRAHFCKYLEAQGVGVRMIFGGDPNTHPAYEHINYRISGTINNTKVFQKRGMWVGCWPGLDTPQLDYMVKTVKDYDECKKKTQIT